MSSAYQARPSSPFVTRGAVVAFCAVILLSMPQPSYAWWGWLEKMSGPGPYKGLLVEVRAFCFGGEKTEFSNLDFRTAVARMRALTSSSDADEAFQTQYNSAVDLLDKAVVQFRNGAASQPRAGATSGATVWPVPLGPLAWRQDLDESLTRLRGARTLTRAQKVSEARAFVARAEQRRDAIRSVGALGTVWSLCDEDAHRQWSLDLGVDYWWSGRKAEFARGQRVHFFTAMPAITFRPFVGRKLDMVDLSVAGGRYLFLSDGFDSFNGWVLHLPRVTLHPPTPWHDLPASDFRRWLAPVTVRLALTVIPDGFPGNPFNAAPPRDIGKEALKTIGLFYNVTSFLHP